MLVCHAGAGEVWCEGEWQPCTAGRAYLCPAQARHAYRAVAGQVWEIAWATLIELPGSKPLIPPGQPRMITTDPRAFTDVIRNLHREALGPAQHLIRARWVELPAVLVARLVGDPEVGDAGQRLDRLWEVIDQDLANAWTLGDLARLADVGLNNCADCASACTNAARSITSPHLAAHATRRHVALQPSRHGQRCRPGDRL